MARRSCACGCRGRGVHRHHVVYAQHCPIGRRSDTRNQIWIAAECHFAHHNRSAPLALMILPDSAYEFAAEVLGPGPAYEYLARRYAGTDARLDALIL